MAYRKEKINDLIRDEVGKILHQSLDLSRSQSDRGSSIRESESGDIPAIVTVMRAVVSDDLNHVRIYISVFPSKFAQPALEQINRQIYFFQQILNKKLKIHPVPKMFFVIDKTEERAAEVEKVIEKVTK